MRNIKIVPFNEAGTRASIAYVALANVLVIHDLKSHTNFTAGTSCKVHPHDLSGEEIHLIFSDSSSIDQLITYLNKVKSNLVQKEIGEALEKGENISLTMEHNVWKTGEVSIEAKQQTVVPTSPIVDLLNEAKTLAVKGQKYSLASGLRELIKQETDKI